MRILSLAPTQAESFSFLEACENLIGITQDYDYSKEVLTAPTLGTWDSFDVRAVLDAEPDLVCTFGKH